MNNMICATDTIKQLFADHPQARREYEQRAGYLGFGKLDRVLHTLREEKNQLFDFNITSLEKIKDQSQLITLISYLPAQPLVEKIGIDPLIWCSIKCAWSEEGERLDAQLAQIGEDLELLRNAKLHYWEKDCKRDYATITKAYLLFKELKNGLLSEISEINLDQLIKEYGTQRTIANAQKYELRPLCVKKTIATHGHYADRDTNWKRKIINN